MCLSKVYEKAGASEKLLLNNIQRIGFDGDSIVFTDLLENDTRITGRLLSADLVNGKVIIETDNT
ncbi:MAG: CooT family nickel-binding protein [Clostridiales bacterium]|jgi:predicted RNA-binding protein|nr:CooT family nickel-binding protein [Clostridiales bacterium]